MLDVLVEVHDLREMERALELGADLIGVNNRNLKTFEVDLATTETLAEEVPDDVMLVSESGIKSPADAMRVLEAGANAVLIGEALMRAHDPSREIEAYLDLELTSHELRPLDRLGCRHAGGAGARRAVLVVSCPQGQGR